MYSNSRKIHQNYLKLFEENLIAKKLKLLFLKLMMMMISSILSIKSILYLRNKDKDFAINYVNVRKKNHQIFVLKISR